MKKSGIVKILIGIMMLTTALIGYIPEPWYFVELTAISNILGGVVLITDGILNIFKGKSLSFVVYMNICVCIITVFLICLGSLTGVYKFNFKGAFFFLHVINPIAFCVCALLFNGYELCSKKKLGVILTSPVLMIAYLIFDYVQCQFSNAFVYGFVSPDELMLFDALIVGVVIYGLMCLFALTLLGINKLIHMRRLKKQN